MEMMKQSNKSKIWRTLSVIILTPIVCIILLLLLLWTPIDYIKYKFSRYYKDTKEKYSWMCAVSCYVRLYDLIKKENLPIEYHRCNDSHVTGYGYFVYKDVLILNDYELSYDPEKQIWLVEIED